MATYYYPLVKATTYYLGPTSIQNPILFLEVDGVQAGGNTVIQTSGSNRRVISVSYYNGGIYLVELSSVHLTDIPSIVKNIKVYVAEVTNGS